LGWIGLDWIGLDCVGLGWGVLSLYLSGVGVRFAGVCVCMCVCVGMFAWVRPALCGRGVRIRLTVDVVLGDIFFPASRPHPLCGCRRGGAAG